MRGSAYQTEYEKKLDSILKTIETLYGSMPHEDRPYCPELHELYDKAEWCLRLIRRD